MNRNRRLEIKIMAIVMVCLTWIAVTVGRSFAQDAGHATDKIAATKNKTDYPLMVIVRGPWAFFRDDVQKQLVAITIDVPGHPSAYIRAQRQGNNFKFGVYDVSLPLGAAGTPTSPQDIVNLSTSSAQFAKIVATPSSLKRYVVRLPMPNNIGESLVDRAKVGDTPHPTTTEQDYTTETTLSYTLTSLNGVRVTGKDNLGNVITPVLLAIPSGIVYVGVASEFIEDPTCDIHAKKAFKDLTGLFGNPLYVDYDPYDPNCPQPLEAQADHQASTMNGAERKTTQFGRTPNGGIQPKLHDLRVFIMKTVENEELRRRLLTDIDVMSRYFEGEHSKKPPHSETRRALDAAMDVRGYLKSVADRDPQGGQMLTNVGAILVQIFNTGGKNCKAPMVLVTVR
jgi:hypothetical protein